MITHRILRAAPVLVFLGALGVPSVPAQAATTAVPGLERVAVTEQAGESSALVWGNYCPNGKAPTGVGAELIGARGRAAITEYSHAERSWGVAAAHEADGGTTDPWSLTGYVICADVVSNWVFGQTANDSTPNKVATASCPTGQLLSGGGASVLSSTGRVALDDVAPSADLRSLRVEAFEDQSATTEAWMVASSLRCVSPLPGQRLVSATSPSSSVVSKSVTATCPAGQKVIGTGHEILNGRGQVRLDDVVPSADLTSVRVEAFEDRDGTTANWSVTAHAICADQ